MNASIESVEALGDGADGNVVELPVAVDQSALPQIGGDPCERADAARNRLKILAAAEKLFLEHGTDNVSMDAVAEAAGVGKGTLYRRFGDRSGLALAILDERDREFQESLIRGEPPLGPGAEPVDRLIAFGQGVMGLIAEHGDLVLAAQSGRPGARFMGPVYPSYRLHVRGLLRDIDPALDDEFFADVLLAALSAELLNFWHGSVGFDADRMDDGFAALVRRVAGRS